MSSPSHREIPTTELTAFADAVWRYDESGGDEMLRRRLLSEWRNEGSRTALHIELLTLDLLRIEREEDLAEAIGYSAVELSTQSGLRNLCQSVFHAALAAEKPLSWKVFSTLGLSAEELQLRVDGEPFCLGQRVFDRYQVTRRIGSGSFGVVYEATTPRWPGRVAIKCATGSSEKKRVQSRALLAIENECLARLVGNGVPRYIETLELSDNDYAIVMELVVGSPLSEILREGPLSQEVAGPIIEQLSLSLDLVHRFGFSHRDLKPQNIIIRPDGKPCLIDLGLVLTDENRLHDHGKQIGTRNYMAPEMLLGRHVQADQRGDIWALGALVYEMLTGNPLQENTSLSEVRKAACFRETSMEADIHSLPVTFAFICYKCLNLHPELRFNRAREIAECLRQASCGKSRKNTSENFYSLNSWRLGVNFAVCFDHCREILDRLPFCEKANDSIPDGGESADRFLSIVLQLWWDLLDQLDLLRWQARPLGLEDSFPERSAEITEFSQSDSELSIKEQISWFDDRVIAVLHHLQEVCKYLADGIISRIGRRYCEFYVLAMETYRVCTSNSKNKKVDPSWALTGIDAAVWTEFLEDLNGDEPSLVWLKLNRAIERQLIYSWDDDDVTIVENPFFGVRLVKAGAVRHWEGAIQPQLVNETQPDSLRK